MPVRRVLTPTILQSTGAECGAVSLAIVLAYFGRIVSIGELRNECGVSRDGSTAHNILHAARHYGLDARGYNKEPDQLASLPLPAILFWNFSHFLVLEGFGDGTVYLNDPSSGTRVVSERKLDESFTGLVLTFTPTAAFRTGGQRRSILAAVRRRLTGCRRDLAFIVLCAATATLPNLAIPAFSRVYVDDILVRGLDRWLRPLLLIMALALLVRASLTYLQQRTIAGLTVALSLRSSGQFMWHVLRLPMTFFGQRLVGEVASRVSLNDRVAPVLSGDLSQAVVATLVMVAYASLMWHYDTVLTSIALAMALVNVLVILYTTRHALDLNRRLAQTFSKLSGVSTQGLQVVETLKATGRESEFFARWAGYQTTASNAEHALLKSSVYVGALPPLLMAMNVAIVLGAGSLRVVDGSLTIGMLLAFQQLMASFMDPVTTLARLGQKSQQATVDLDRLDDILEQPRDVGTDGPALATGGTPTRLEGAVTVTDLTFGYTRRDPPLVRNFSLTLQPGQRVALVGASGSGKSTVAKLIAGLHEPWSGEVSFDGIPRRELPRPLLTLSVAMVDQDIRLFRGTIRQNVALWDSTMPDADVVAAASAAQLHDDITRRPGGYEARLDEGGRNFSGGQRQRLEIARALALKPRVLILDEATSALDPVTEEAVLEAIRLSGATCLIVAHRLSTVRDCDEILVLDSGVVAQRGTHETLMSVAGPYRDLSAAH